MGRKKIEIDFREAERLAGLGLSQAEIACRLGISEDTLTRRKKDSADVADALKKGIAEAKEKIGNKLFELAEKGDLGAIIWFEKSRFGYSDKMNVDASVQIRLIDESD